MNKYKIQQKIKTLSKLDFFNPNGTEIEIEGYFLKNWNFSTGHGPTGDAWLLTKEINAENLVKAVNKFRNDFKEISSKLALISQCYFDYLGESFLIEKLNNNKDKNFFIKYVKDSNPRGLYFTKDFYDSFIKLNNINELKGNIFFTYIQECNNTIGYYSKLSLLCSALESLAGKVEKTDDCGKTFFTYSKKTMKLILGKELFNKIFGNNGLRHKIQHGDSINDFFDSDYVSIIYKKILEYLNITYNLGINLEIKYPQRNFYGNIEYMNLYLKAKDKNQKIDLRNFNEKKLIISNDSNYILIIDVKDY